MPPLSAVSRDFYEIGACEELPWAVLSAAAQDAWSLLAPAAPTPAAADFLGIRPLPRGIAERQHVRNAVPDIRVYAVPGAKVAGRSHILKQGRIVSAQQIHPAYIRHYYFQQWFPLPDFEGLAQRRIEHPVFLVTNASPGHYGHFLLECLPKVYVVQSLHEAGIHFPVLLPSDYPSYAVEIMQSIHPAIEFCTYDSACEVAEPSLLLVPSLCHDEYLFHPACIAWFRTLAQAAATGAARPAEPPKHIFLSRSRLPADDKPFRQIVNRDRIEQLAAGLGYTIVHPQELGFQEQMALFAGAETVIGEYGSALHNTLFSGPGTRILCINWLNDVQQRLAQSCNQEIGFVLPADGQPRWLDAEIEGASKFEIVPEEFMAAVANLRLGTLHLRPFLWFDPAYYLQQNPDVAASPLTPWEHYDQLGWREGRDPSPYFSSAGYLADYPDVRDSGGNPLTHYLNCGIGEGRRERPGRPAPATS